MNGGLNSISSNYQSYLGFVFDRLRTSRASQDSTPRPTHIQKSLEGARESAAAALAQFIVSMLSRHYPGEWRES